MYPVTTCKKPEHYCKAWDDKGSPKKNLLADEICLDSREADTCEFLVTTRKREDCDWLYKTIAGSPVETAEIVQEEHRVIAKKVKKIQHRTCADCKENATHKIEGYKPVYLCIEHAETAQADGFALVELTEEERNV